MITFRWPIVGVSALALALAIVIALILADRRRTHRTDDPLVFDVSEAWDSDEGASLLSTWKRLNRVALVALSSMVILSIILLARPSTVNSTTQYSSNRDIILCLDVSGSTLPYDREVIDTYLDVAKNASGERIGLSIFNSTSRTVFPLTDDYELVENQLSTASSTLKVVQSQADIDDMSDEDYQEISDWLDGTQNKKDSTSLIGDGLVGCASMLPGFVYGSSASSSTGGTGSTRNASILLATDNVTAGTPTYTLAQALSLTSQASITVDGMFSGPQDSLSGDAASSMKNLIEKHGGMFMSATTETSVQSLVRELEKRRSGADRELTRATVTDSPGWWTLALAVITALWMATAWRLRR